MKLHLTAFTHGLLMAAATFCAEGHDTESAANSSIPPHVYVAFDKFVEANRYRFSTHINPFYLQGDFNGDGKIDTAILVKNVDTDAIGVAIIHGVLNTVQVYGAGTDFGNGGNNFSWMNAWYTYQKGNVTRGADVGEPPKLRGDAIMDIKSDAASALIYWTGQQYKWYQQGD